MSEATILILFTVLLLLLMFVLPQILLKRAITTTIRAFRQSNASGVQKAKTIDELGLRPKNMSQAIFREASIESLLCKY